MTCTALQQNGPLRMRVLPHGHSHSARTDFEDIPGSLRTQGVHLRVSRVHGVSQTEQSWMKSSLGPQEASPVFGRQIPAATPPALRPWPSPVTSPVAWKWPLPLKCADHTGDQSREGQDASYTAGAQYMLRSSRRKGRHWHCLLVSLTEEPG